MTRQPAAEKRFTVAWPMPRLAPVRSSARRGWLDCGVGIGAKFSGADASSRIEPRLGPRGVRRRAAKLDAVVQAVRAVVPELHDGRRDAVADPERRPRQPPEAGAGGHQRDRLLECEAAFQRRRLLARPRADLREPRAAGEIGVGLGVGYLLDR